jgi:hypothetical protein
MRCVADLVVRFAALCSLQERKTMEPKNDPIDVFDAFNAAVNAHNIVTALNFFADDAIVQFPNQPPPNRY